MNDIGVYSTMYVWPSHYPQSCPPATAEPANGPIYRFMNKSVPTAKDFRPYYDADPAKSWGELSCQARGLSVYPDLNACREAASKVPGLAKKKLAVGMMLKSYGVIAETPSRNTSRHLTWWVAPGCPEPETFFEPLDLGASNA